MQARLGNAGSIIDPLGTWAVFYSLKGNIQKNVCPSYVDKNNDLTYAANDLTATFSLGINETLINLVAKLNGNIIPGVTISGTSITVPAASITGTIVIEAAATGVAQGGGSSGGNLVVDNIPTENSTNLVSSGGVYAAIAEKQSLPEGGTMGQVLAKISSTDFDVNWIDATSGASISMISRAQLPFTNIPYSEGQLYYTTEAGGLYIDRLENNVQVRKRIYPTSIQVPLVITYNMNGHGSNTTKTVYYEEGQSYILQANDFSSNIPDTDGYRFLRWDNSENLIGTPITEDITINSIWNQIEYVQPTITYVVGHGSLPSGMTNNYSINSIEVGLYFSLPAAQLTALGENVTDGAKHYKFDGWYDENNRKITTSNGNNSFQADSEHLTIVLTAHWIELKQYTITYSVENGTAPSTRYSTWVENTYNLTTSDLNVSPTLNDSTNYRFKYWKKDGTQVTVGTSINSNVVLVAHIVSLTAATLTYTTAYNTKASRTYYLEPGQSFHYTTEDLEILTANGYRHAGWYLSGDTNQTLLTTSSTFNASKELVAKWIQQKDIVITYATDVGNISFTNPKTHTVDITNSYALTASDIPTLANTYDWNFNGWYYDNIRAQVGQSLNESKTFEARWTESSVPLYYYGVSTYPMVTSDLTRTRTSDNPIIFSGNANDNTKYFYFLTTSVPTKFQYDFDNENSWITGGFSSMGTIDLDNKTFNVWRSTESSWRTARVKVTM